MPGLIFTGIPVNQLFMGFVCVCGGGLGNEGIIVWGKPKTKMKERK